MAVSVIKPRLAAVVAAAAVGIAALPGTAAPASAADRPSPRDWRAPSASVELDPAKVVDTAPKGRALEVTITTRSADGPRVRTVRAKDRADARRIVAKAQDADGTLAVGMAQPMKKAATDPYRSDQWALGALGATTVWKRTTGSNVTVGVVDSGVQASHPDLKNQVLAGWDVVRNTAAGNRDADGHGTFVAGIIAARLNNGIGIAGLAPSSKILPVKVEDAEGYITSDDVAKGITWATNHGAQVINISLVTDEDDPSVASAVRYAQSREVVVVAAVGNDKLEGNPVEYPAAYPGVIGAGAVDSKKRIASFSNTGSYVDVVAPGVDVLSTHPGFSNPYAFGDGTSFASPYTAATAALAVATTGPGYSAATIADQITSTATDLGAAGRDDVYGHGFIAPLKVITLAACPTSDIERLCGADRYATAAKVSAASFSPGVRTAYIASGTGFADALGGSLSAALDDSPMLLTKPTELPTVTRDELNRLRPQRIVVLGGTAAVSSRVASALMQYTAGSVTRLAGADRYDTSVRTARAAFPTGAKTAFVASGEQFPDALSGVPAAAKEGGPLLLTRKGSLPAGTASLLDQLGVDSIVVLGGTGAVSTAVSDALARHGAVTRVQGADRYTTSAGISRQFFGSASAAYIASGAAFPDALAGSAVAGGIPAPVLLTARSTLPDGVRSELRRLAPGKSVILGGVAAVSETVRRQVAAP